MMEKSLKHTCNNKAIVVLDTGIVIEEDLEMILAKGQKHFCISRSGLKEYESIPDKLTVLLE